MFGMQRYEVVYFMRNMHVFPAPRNTPYPIHPFTFGNPTNHPTTPSTPLNKRVLAQLADERGQGVGQEVRGGSKLEDRRSSNL